MTMAEDDPFKDPALGTTETPQPPEPSTNVPDTLAVGRNASLTLGQDSLVVLDEALLDNNGGCCGISSLYSKNKTTRSIPFFNILWAEQSEDGEITIQYAHAVSKQVVRPAIISYTLDKTDNRTTHLWIEKLLDRAYGASKREKRVKVLINPFGGQGGAVKIYHKHIAPIFAAARCELDVEKTTHNGHAVEIAQGLDVDAYDVIACCSGDGIPHEVWNGLGKRHDAARALVKTAIAQLPCGSGNGMSLNFNGTDSPSLAALAVVKGLRTPLDLTSITQGDQRTLSFMSQSVGLVAECDLATENLRWMGSARFTWGTLTRVLRKTIYPADIAIKVEYSDKEAIRQVYRTEAGKPPRSHDDREIPAADAGLPPLQHGTINDPLPSSWELVPHDKLGNFYAGNMAYMSPDANFFPASLPNDGCIDVVRVRGDLKRHTAIATLLAVAENKFFEQPTVDYQKVTAYRFIPKNQADGYISIDGERVPFEPFQVEVHRGLGTVLSKTGHIYEAKGV
ncbi:sphingoid long chain base kinase-like protein [Aaosphaeria arxii CBS 175.79]|uniref:Sphingoid long chain base kinase-like protein n=1 Tax=Aaosphaeria arxii CBS 175.79 TaxID=1450172 RepID=A0A6A5Y015_9PLEO|nr:sphingoid long chain base kinase-like protein [Aaosphaeria arxii CBS 175.79]KAF2018888.1 sphingoid long chain base kinase-like protein [Aaosphaeria arxii CBS 175.79]